jgi:hypothetical protein
MTKTERGFSCASTVHGPPVLKQRTASDIPVSFPH